MKHQIFALLIGILCSILVIAQPTQGPYSLKGEAKDFAFGVNVNGLINNINLTPQKDVFGNDLFSIRYFARDDFAYKLGIGLIAINQRFSRVDSVAKTQVEFDSVSTKFDFFINPSIEKHFTNYKRLDPYLGAGLNIGVLGKQKNKSTTMFTDTSGVAKREFDVDRPGGFMFGLNTYIGMNYFIAQKLSLGFEYTFGFYNSRIGGDETSVLIDTPISGQSKITRQLSSNVETTNAFNFTNRANITLTFFFGKNKS